MTPDSTVTWRHSRIGSDDQGWAGCGRARITNYDENRAFFGPPVGSGNPGKAVEIQLLHNDLKCWVPIEEIEATYTDETPKEAN